MRGREEIVKGVFMADSAQVESVQESIDRLFSQLKADVADLLLAASMDGNDVSDDAFMTMIKGAERAGADVAWVLGTLGLLGTLSSYREAMSAIADWSMNWSDDRLPDQATRHEILEKLSFALSGQT